nr:MAG TPA: hypothetical protein [Caudoviricetes sp.]
MTIQDGITYSPPSITGGGIFIKCFIACPALSGT